MGLQSVRDDIKMLKFLNLLFRDCQVIILVTEYVCL
jgi:hypothetical protein